MKDFSVLQKAKIRLNIWRRKRVQKRFGVFFDTVSEILFRHDPIGINFEENTDEYDPETGTILPRLAECKCSADLRRVICEEFSHWFGPEYATDEMHYDSIAQEIWKAWCSNQPSLPRA